MYHPKWKKMINFGPGKVLNQIKELVKQGLAQQLSPVPVPEPPPEPTKPPVFKQQNLFAT
jgi:hypothetical protein